MDIKCKSKKKNYLARIEMEEPSIGAISRSLEV